MSIGKQRAARTDSSIARSSSAALKSVRTRKPASEPTLVLRPLAAAVGMMARRGSAGPPRAHVATAWRNAPKAVCRPRSVEQSPQGFLLPPRRAAEARACLAASPAGFSTGCASVRSHSRACCSNLIVASICSSSAVSPSSLPRSSSVGWRLSFRTAARISLASVRLSWRSTSNSLSLSTCSLQRCRKSKTPLPAPVKETGEQQGRRSADVLRWLRSGAVARWRDRNPTTAASLAPWGGRCQAVRLG